MAIHFKADLRPVVGEHVGMLHWILDPEARGVIVGYDLSDNNVLVCHIHVSSNVYKVFIFAQLKASPRKAP